MEINYTWSIVYVGYNVFSGVSETVRSCSRHGWCQLNAQIISSEPRKCIMGIIGTK